MLQFLVVEPDRGVSELLQEALQEVFEARVALSGNGEQAERVLQECALDLAIIETMLPDISGFELAERAANRGVPSLLMSGHPTGQENCRAHGYPHLAKPFSLQEMVDAIRAIFHDSQQAIACLHRSYETLNATVGWCRMVAEFNRQIKAEIWRIGRASRLIREQSRMVRIEGAVPWNARMPSPAPRSLERSIILHKILVLRSLLREIGTETGRGIEHQTRLLLAEEKAKLAVLDSCAADAAGAPYA